MSTLCQRMISLFMALALTVSTMVVLSGCERKSKPERVGEKVGEAVEEAGEAVEEAGRG